MLVMFVLITIVFSDLSFYEEEESRIPNPETTISSGTAEEDQPEAMEIP
jgi:hypothetical protein